MPGISSPYAGMRKTRLIHKIEALERYCRSLEKANQVGISGGEVLYMDKEKARLIEELLKRDRLVASLSELVRQLQTENETLGEQLEELVKAKLKELSPQSSIRNWNK